MILENTTQFIDIVYKELSELGIDTSHLKIDHIGYQADSAEDYDSKSDGISDESKKVSENIVGGRRVGIFQLNESLMYVGKDFSVVEVFEPREGQEVESAWEHVEFLVEGSLENFMQKYPEVEWDTSTLDRDEFPMLILKLGDGLRAKFPRLGVLDEADRIKGKSVASKN